MSLTTLLTNKDVRKKFSEEFPMPKFGLEKDILAPPRTNHYIIVGIAFDYLMRFYLQRLNPETISHPWVAEHAPDLVKDNKEQKIRDVRAGRAWNGAVGSTTW